MGGILILWNVLYVRTIFNRPYLFEIWQFSAITSTFMIFPDWFLVEGLGTLIFPLDSGYQIGGAIPWYMGIMWTIPFVFILNSCPGAGEPALEQLKLSAVVSGFIFGFAE